MPKTAVDLRRALSLRDCPMVGFAALTATLRAAWACFENGAVGLSTAAFVMPGRRAYALLDVASAKRHPSSSGHPLLAYIMAHGAFG
jgi:hypothetical protein